MLTTFKHFMAISKRTKDSAESASQLKLTNKQRMEACGSSEAPVLQEHDPMTELLSQIPHKVQRGMKSQHELLELTCMDVNQHFIALGSSVGTVFLYDREKHTIQRLRSEDTMVTATCVALHHGLDHLVAIGYSSGAIYIFQLPSMLMGHSKQLERFIVEDLHQTILTNLAWSTNGMKLFSGDTKGCVGCTEVDFIDGKCKSSPLLIESSTEIVQLDQGHRSLLVSTNHRCIVCRMDDKDRITQVGSKDRKITGDFGASFIPAICKPDDAQLFATRPGFRIWKASINGTVNNTFIFKELLAQNHTQIPLLDFEVTNIEAGQRTNQFGRVLLYKDNQLVTWNESCIFVLDIEKTAVVGSQCHIGRIKDVRINDDEIFILRKGTDRNVIRLAHKPLPASKHQLLKQLQEERLQRDAELKAKELEKKSEEAATGSNESLDKGQEKSPFKFLQDNLIDKVKVIAKPAVLKDKIQEKLKLDNKKETPPPSKYTQEYVFEGETKDPKRESSPPGALPPVIRLDSPDLLTVEIREPISEINITKVPSSERFSALSGDSSQFECGEICTNENQPTIKRTGTGAASALARLQEDHETEENSGPVFRVAENQATEVKQEDEDEEANSIVFNPKNKQKKKKKGGKGRRSRASELIVDPDPDTVSINSGMSVDSHGSDHSSPVRQSINDMTIPDPGTSVSMCSSAPNTGIDEHIEGAVDETDANQASEIEITRITNNSVDKRTIEQGTNDVPDRAEGIKSDNCDTDNKDNDESVIRGNTKDEKFDISEEMTNATEDLARDLQSSTATSEVAVEGNKGLADSQDMTGKVDKALSDTQVKTEVDFERFLQTTDPAASNLDKEMARLDSYLSISSDSPAQDFETSTSTVGSYRSGLSSDTLLESGNISAYESSFKSDSGNTINKLENQLQQLDLEAFSNMDSQGQSFPEPQRSMESLPSMSSLDRTPSLPGDDFYSKYVTKSPSEFSPTLDETSEDDSNEDIVKSKENKALKAQKMIDTCHFLKTTNNWTEIVASGNIHSLCVSSTHVWITDRSYNIYYSSLYGPGISWKKATGNASQISVSLCGTIVWILYKNTVSAGTKVTQKRPEGMKWVEAVRDVAYMCVDQSCAWYIKTNFEVMIMKGLSKDRPCYKADYIDCSHRLKQIVCRGGVVWALTEKCKWLYRSGITNELPEGKEWKCGDSGSENRLFIYLSLGDDKYGWAVDVVGQVWFCTGVSMETPRGDGKWWQVPLSGEYFMKDPTTLDLLKSFSTKFDPNKLTQLLTAQSGGLVSGTGGVWVCPEFKHVLHVCRGNIEGQFWDDAQPVSLSSTSVWKTLACGNAANMNGLIWGQQPSSDLFAFSVDLSICSNIVVPVKKGSSQLFVCMSVCTDALWGLTCDGEIQIRTGMTPLEPKGNGWCKLDLSQIEESHLVHISCSRLSVWAVDSDGQVFHRIGVKAPSDLSLNAAWLPVDNGGTVFTQIIAGSQDWKVWAIDNRRQIYVRTGITQEMPIGRKWMHVSGTQAMQLTLSDSFVWALNHSGELLCRHGVTEENPTGDYWKKLPGFLSYISAAPNNALWGVNKDGYLLRRRTKYIIKETDFGGQGRERASTRGLSLGSDDGDWELV